jgi:hypothetical protein
MDEFQKFKFILSSNDLDICKICILGVNKLYSINQDLKGKLLKKCKLYNPLFVEYDNNIIIIIVLI